MHSYGYKLLNSTPVNYRYMLVQVVLSMIISGFGLYVCLRSPTFYMYCYWEFSFSKFTKNPYSGFFNEYNQSDDDLKNITGGNLDNILNTYYPTYYYEDCPNMLDNLSRIVYVSKYTYISLCSALAFLVALPLIAYGISKLRNKTLKGKVKKIRNGLYVLNFLIGAFITAMLIQFYYAVGFSDFKVRERSTYSTEVSEPSWTFCSLYPDYILFVISVSFFTNFFIIKNIASTIKYSIQYD
jgi:hypothetical protein